MLKSERRSSQKSFQPTESPTLWRGEASAEGDAIEVADTERDALVESATEGSAAEGESVDVDESANSSDAENAGAESESDRSSGDAGGDEEGTAQEAADAEGESSDHSGNRLQLVTEADPQQSQRRVLAKVYGDDRRMNERRWAVGGSPRRCHTCSTPIPPQAEYYGTLEPTRIPEDDSKLAEVSALFDRYDYCCACYEGGAGGHAFAYWKGHMDAPQREPRKVVNLAALLVYFQHLAAVEAAASRPTPDADGDDGEGTEGTDSGHIDSGHIDEDLNDEDAFDGDFERQQEARERAAIVAALPRIDGDDARLMRYLLALFLIRKRVLKWGASSPRCVGGGRSEEQSAP